MSWQSLRHPKKGAHTLRTLGRRIKVAYDTSDGLKDFLLVVLPAMARAGSVPGAHDQLMSLATEPDDLELIMEAAPEHASMTPGLQTQD